MQETLLPPPTVASVYTQIVMDQTTDGQNFSSDPDLSGRSIDCSAFFHPFRPWLCTGLSDCRHRHQPLFGLVGSETKDMQHVAEVGIVMMLFLIDLTLSPRAL